MSVTIAGAAMAFLAILAFWKQNVLLFMITGGVSLMVGFQWYDVYTTNTGLSISLMLVAFSLVCFAFGFRALFWRKFNKDG